MISAFFRAFTSGNLDPDRTHFWLLLGAFALEIIVGVGIVIETPYPPKRKEFIALCLVIGGILIGIMVTLGLFVFDEAISRNQQSKIIELETRIAPRNLDHNSQSTIARQMAKWSTLPASNAKQSAIVIPTSDVFENEHIANQIIEALSSAGWEVRRNTLGIGHSLSLAGVGLMLPVSPRAKPIGEELKSALNEVGIDTFIMPEPGTDCVALKFADRMDTDPACSSISIFVGNHP